MEDLLEQRKLKAKKLVFRAEILKNVEGKAKLQKKIVAEQEFLNSLEKRLKDDDNQSLENNLRSSNLAHLEALLTTAEAASNLDSILKKIPYQINDQIIGELVVDVESQHGKCWFKVFARNPNSLHRIWEGLGQYGDKDVCKVALDYKKAASQHLIHFCQPKIVFLFACGVTKSVAKDLEEMGIYVVGDQIDDPDSECFVKIADVADYEFMQSSVSSLVTSWELSINAESSISKVNLDVTTLIAIVSSLSNGNCYFEFEDEVLNAQAAEERDDPVLPSLNKFLHGKDLFASETAINAFNSILNTIGGEMEHERAEKLSKQLTIVKDCPSERSLQLCNSASINSRSKVIFGTGDSLQAITTTANRSVVRAAHNQGVSFSVFLHAPRALTERKETKARALQPK